MSPSTDTPPNKLFWLNTLTFSSNTVQQTRIRSLAVLLAAALLWAYALPQVNLRAMADFGLLSVLPPTFYVALALVLVNFALLVHAHPELETLLFLHVFLLILIFHATPPILYGTLRYSWAWKHIGVIDYIQRHGAVNPTIQFLDAYHNWPGFFTLTAVMTEAAGYESALTFAPWAQIFFNTLNLGALLLIYRTFTQDKRLIWLSVCIFFLTNWVGQDYFAPQAFGYLLHLVIIGMSLYWFKKETFTNTERIRRWLRKAWLFNLYKSFFRSRSDDEMVPYQTRPFERVGITLIIVLLMAAVASSHQLTPFMTILALGALVLMQRTQTGSLALLIVIFTLSWVLFAAAPFTQDNVKSIIEDFGALVDNADQTLISLGEVSRDQAVIATIGRLLTLSVMMLAGLGGLHRWLKGYRDIAVILLILAPFLMLAGNSYGGEMLFRLFLFIVPFISFFAATLFYATPESGRGWKTAVFITLTFTIMAGGFLFAYLGKERQFYFTQEEVAAAKFLYETAPDGSLLIEGSKNYPGQFINYEHFFYVPLSREDWDEQLEFMEDPETTFVRWMSNERFTASYLLITRSQKAEVEMLGQMPPGALDVIEQKLEASDAFELLYENQDARIFILADGNDEEQD